MDFEIMLQTQHYKHGRAAALRGDQPDSHGLHWNSLAQFDWQRGYESVTEQDRLEVAEP
ncbi:hypothetical protein [Pseudoduganella chitinolytica]|uniref:Uncharacterized protein n=1 Tax=Pseudoduganella chitinolytica TaxID=34070 RepID=A0ABY8BG46_9BURK|nr:hypothetical protein [Pseudoduganella chitinolytica]WEF34887.1 hypothetical protein PX653_09045 [Pseudoduganella chitinolytica]